ncbi:16S rRNA (cytosine(1402)-N(4))-methyltransferase RsmH [Patescibacteria group bacterium]|nr:16S rRNA (cytosine(1402)-N(4))-methyltransferase RsmH [Patescibacteria group bacterium]
MIKNSQEHQAVLVKEVIEALDPQKDHYYIDATFGRGGHSREILKRGAKVIAFDFDQQSIERAKELFSKEIDSQQLILLRENFNKMKSSLSNLKKSLNLEISGILFDFGTSTDQLMSKDRGFSFEAHDEILDMRMDDRLGVKACDLLKLLDEKQLGKMLFEYGGENDARAIAKKVVALRKKDPNSLDKVGTLVDIIEEVKGRGQRQKLHAATKTFQALRIIVNDELTNIEEALPMALEILRESKAIDKKIVSIAFHEGEDRLVKTFFKDIEAKNLGKIINKKPIQASEQEILENPRSRSAKLRVLAV